MVKALNNVLGAYAAAIITPARRQIHPAGLGVTVCIPARNEEQNISEIIEGVRYFCEEVLVVDGHSSDRTADIATRCGARVIKDNKKGQGDAIRVGAGEAKYPIIVFMDADGSHDPADIPALVKDIQDGKADLTIGSRGKGGSDELHGDVEKLIRMIGSDIILIGINLRWKQHLTDCQNGFRAVRRDVILSLGLKENISTIEQEMTMKCLKMGYVITEVPSHEYARKYGVSTIILRRVWFRFVYSFFKHVI